MKLTDIIKGTEYDLSLFSDKHIAELENRIVERKTNGGGKYYLTCLVRKKEIKLTPEEVVRQLYLLVLIEDYGYSTSKMELEYEVTFGREKKRADIVIFDKQDTTAPFIIVEVKKPKLKDGKEQLKSYCNATGAPIGVWSNGKSISYYHRKDPNYFEDLSSIPRADQKLSDIISERWTIDDLIKKDKLVNERKSLKDLILEMEDEVLANAGVDVFEEVFKLIFTKLYDEMESGRKKDRNLVFRNYGDTEEELRDKLQDLFDQAKEKWAGVFSEDAKLQLAPSHLSVCVASLQDVKLFNSNLEVVDEAFEYLISKNSKGEKGQYFTPRYVIDMCVKMLNPKEDEKMIDTAAGSCGFPVHTIFHVWQNILDRKGLKRSHLFTLEQKPAECTDYVQNNVFAIDFDERRFRGEFGYIKLGFDVTLVAIACLLSLVFMSGVYGVREGTVISALVVGPIVHFVSPYYRFLDKWITDASVRSVSEFSKGQHVVITIAREYGSGGHLLGEMLSKELGIKLYDKEFIRMAAQRSGMDEQYIVKNEQSIPSFWLKCILSKNSEQPLESSLSSDDVLFVSESKIIQELAAKESCIIVGRCADFVLKDYPKVLKLFCYSDLSHAVTRCVSEYGIAQASAEAEIKRVNRNRIHHYEYYTGEKWGEPHRYDLMLNTGTLDLKTACQLVKGVYQGLEKA